MLGRPLTDLRISVIDQCNFRCTYCMPAGLYPSDYPFLPSSARLSFAQIETMARAFVRLGVDKIRITGGEPLLRKNLERLIEALAKLTTPDGRYRYRDGGGEVGFISSVSQPFCGDCSRVRVSSDGQMFLCLFARDGIDLRPHLDTAQALETVLRRHWRGRGDCYSEVRGALARAGGRPGKQYATVNMSLVGG